MRKFKAHLLCLLGVLFVAVLAVGFGAVLRYEPHFYRNRAIESGADRKQRSSKFANDFAQMLLNAKGQDGWHLHLKEAEINSFLQEDLVNFGEADNLRRLGISDPRIAFEDGCIRFGFRYGTGFWSTVVSYDLHLWTVPKEPNVLVVEIRSRRFGALPVSAQTVVTDLVKLAERHNVEVRGAQKDNGGKKNVIADLPLLSNIDVTPYRYEGNPVALVRFQADQAHPTAYLKCLHIRPGELCIGGTMDLGGHPRPSGKVQAPAAN
jgi:hypothetical protein